MRRASLFALSILTTVGCNADLGKVPFICNVGVPECPEGYRCQGKRDNHHGVCVREGQTVPIPDMGPADQGPDGVTPPDQGPQKDLGQPLPPLKITEIMIDPQRADTENKGEWFEVHNAGKETLQLDGWTIRFKDTAHQIPKGANLLLKSKAYWVFGHTKDPQKNGNAPVDYAYGDPLVLSNVASEIQLVDPDGRLVDRVAYSQESFTIPTGGSLSVRDPFAANKSDSANWCAETASWGLNTDKGTPGAAPGCR